MPKSIHKRWVEVSFVKTPPSGQEAVQYRLSALPTDPVLPPPWNCLVKWQQLVRWSDQVQACVHSLMDAARLGKRRDGIELESTIAMMARRVLPPAGVSSLFQRERGIHPWFDIWPPAFADLPWEAFPESFRLCDNRQCTLYGRPLKTRADAPRSPGSCECGRPLRQVERKLAFGWHVAHVAHGNEATPPPQGKEFLIVADPTGDLLRPENDPTGLARQHIGELMGLLQNAGYEVEVLRGEAATDIDVLESLKNPKLMGVYFYGHGFLDKSGDDEGCLLLHGNRPVFASDIEELRPRCQFVYINACHGAAAGQDWGFDKPLRSMAHAFAGGGTAKVVIAPIWPVISSQAATMALDFFRSAVRGCRLSKALLWARRRSYRRYQGNSAKNEGPQPDYCWAAYRYFGDPDRTLPMPVEEISTTAIAIDRIFAQGQLHVDLFSFPIDEVLLRAAKRRNLQGRKEVTCTDFLAGMVRRGELTRSALRRSKTDPDQLYRRLQDAPERGGEPERDSSPTASPSRTISEELDRWVIRDRGEFHCGILDILRKADETAQQGGKDCLISEMDVLEAYLESPCWDNNQHVSLPRSEEIRRLIHDESWRRHIDANGRVILANLDPGAKKIIDRAHDLAQLRGVCPIPTRLMLVAFLLDDRAAPARLCESQEVHVDSLSAVLLAVTGGKAPETFELGDHACSRIVTPMVLRARQLSGESAIVSELHLFQAFCEVAPENLKQALRALPKPWRLDLDAIFDLPGAETEDRQQTRTPAGAEVEIPPTALGDTAAGESGQETAVSRNQFEKEAWRVVLLGAHWARLQGSSEIRSPHLFAALVGDGTGPIGTMFRRANMDSELGKILVLMMIPVQTPTTRETSTVRIGANVGRVLLRAIQLAGERGPEKANLDDIIESFLVDGGGAVGEALRKLGVDTRPWWRHFESGSNGNGQKPENT